MTYNIVYSAQAKRDLRSIYEYIAFKLLAPEAAGKQAQRILDGVFENYGFNDGIYRVYNQDEFWGVGEAKDGVLRIKSYVR